MRHFACAGKRKKEEEEGAHLRVPLKAKHGFWAENSTMDTKVSFKLKGASGSLKMDPHPLLMPSLPCLFCSRMNSMQKGKRRLVQKCFIPVSYLYYCFHLALLGGGWLPLWCQRRVRLPFEISRIRFARLQCSNIWILLHYVMLRSRMSFKRDLADCTQKNDIKERNVQNRKHAERSLIFS